MGRSISTVPADSRVSVPVTTNHTVSSGEILLIDTSGGTELTLTLPASPRQGDRVNLIDVAGTTATTKAIIARNGNKIANLAEDLDFDVKNASLELFYSGSAYGWSILSN